MTIAAIETRYAGHRFRSRLEARWAVLFDHLGVSWEYEPQGFVLGDKPYLPDFLLTDCGTWVEVKGSGAHLDTALMESAALHLPEVRGSGERGPKLLILGPMPPESSGGDWAWTGLEAMQDEDGVRFVEGGHFGFGSYAKNLRPWRCFNTSTADHFSSGDPASDWLKPFEDPYESGVPDAYSAARMARFEHGESGAAK